MIFQDIIRSTKRVLRLFPHEKVESAVRVSLTEGRKKVIDVIAEGQGDLTMSGSVTTNSIGLVPLRRNLDLPTKTIEALPRHQPVLWWASRHNPLWIFVVTGVLIMTILLLGLQLGKAQMLKDRIRDEAMQGYTALFAIRQDLSQGRLEAVSEKIATARAYFLQAETELSAMAGFQKFLNLEGTDIAVLSGLLQAGNHLSLAAEKYRHGVGQLLALVESGQAEKPLTQNLREIFGTVGEGSAALRQADKIFQQISRDPELSSKFTEMKKITDQVEEQLPVLLAILGDPAPRRYMVLLQNQDEIRPTGGFIGSVLFLTLEQGNLKEWSFQDIYNLDGQISKKIPAAYPLSLITENFGMRDSNTSPDFATSAETALGLLEEKKWGKVDGVLAVNQSLIIDLLQAAGPISIPDRKVTLSAENFSLLLSAIVETKIDKDQPKTVLKEFIPLFTARLAQLDKTVLLDLLLQHISERNLAVYFSDPAAEKLAKQYALSGSMANPENVFDYLLVAETSVSGNKSDRMISNQLTHETYVDKSGHVTDHVTLQRAHSYIPAMAEGWQEVVKKNGLAPLSSDMIDLLGRGENRTYVEFYVPLGSTLLVADGVSKSAVRVSQKNGFQVFGFLVTTNTGGSSKITLSYQLPRVLDLTKDDSYRLILEKQVGGKMIAVEKKIFVDNAVEFRDAFPVDAEDKKYTVLTTLTNSLQFSALLTLSN